jgi:hypothetical protein
MIEVELNPTDVLPERTNYDLQIERDPTFMELAKANFQNENPIYALGRKLGDKANSLLSDVASKTMTQITGQEVDNNYDLFEDPRWQDPKYTKHIDRAIGIESRFDADTFFRNVDMEDENRATMAAGGVEGVAASFATGLLDPFMFIPIGGAAYKTYREGGNILKGAARTGLMTGAATSAEEVMMHSLQETRTAEDSAWNIAGATFLGGVMGGAATALGHKEFLKLSERVKEDLRSDTLSKIMPDKERGSVGAALAQTTSLDDEALKSAFGLEKLFSFQDPLLRMANSPSKVARQHIEMLADSPLVRNKNSQFIASEHSVENMIKSYELPKYLHVKERDRLFLEYRNSKSKMAVKIGDAADALFKRSRKDGMLTHQEFKEAMSDAAMNGDTHEIPQVAAAARDLREKVITPLFNEAKAVGLIDPKTPFDENYLMRMWDHGAIKANRREFEQLNATHLKQKRDKAASELQDLFKGFDLNNDARVANAVAAERENFKAHKAATKTALKDEAAGGGKVEKIRMSISELQTRLDDATKNQQRIYAKILNKRKRGDDNLADLFNEFKSVSSAKRELYKKLNITETDAEKHTKEFWRREQIANHLTEQEKLLETKMMELEDQTKLMEDLEYRASFNDDDFDHISYQLTDRILGTQHGRLSYDNKLRTGKGSGSAGKRGPAKARLYDIPNSVVKDFIVRDSDMILEGYVRSLASDIELTKKFGSIDPEDARKAIQDDYEKLMVGVDDPAKLEALRKLSKRDDEDFTAVWERLRGTYQADDYASGWRSTERSLMNVNYLSMLGGMTMSAFADVARPVMVHGLGRVMGDGFGALMTDTASFMKAAKDVMESSTALDMATNTRAKAMFGGDEFTGFTNKVEGITSAMAQNFGVLTLMAPWNAAMKQFSGVITQNRMMKAVIKVSEGKTLSPKEIENLASHGINERMAKRIAKQFAEHGEVHNTVHIPNARDWKDIDAAKVFRGAVRKQVDEIIVTPGQDKPLWMSKSGWRLAGQFRSFSVASIQRTMLSGLQQRDMAVLNGSILSVALGSLSYIAKSQSAGRDPDLSAGTLLREGVDRSGLLGWLSDANAVSDKVSRGRISVNGVFGGPPMSRYASRSALEAVFGPTYGMAGNLTQVAGNALVGDWQAADTHTIRRMTPYNNVFYVRGIFDDAEKNINDALGVKGK